jgi:glycosyltransferase involved in cell wall biosynthesis
MSTYVNQAQPSVSFSLHDGWTLGGTTTWSVQMATALVKRGWSVNLLVHRNPEGRPWEIDSRIKVVPVGGYTAWFPRYMYLPEFCKTYRQVLPTIYIPNSSSGTYAACAELTKHHQQEMRIIGTLHSDWQGCYEWAVYYQSVLSRILVPSMQIERKLHPKLETANRHLVERRIYPIIGFKNSKVSERVVEAPISIIYSGRICEDQKRFSHIMEIANRLNERHCHYQLHIHGVGSAGELEEYKNRADEISRGGRSQIIFHGKVDRESLMQAYAEADIYLSTSEYEGASLALLEAMAAGCVPVVTDVSGVMDVVRSDSGYVRKFGDIEGMADCICDLDRNREHLGRLSCVARMTLHELCDFDSYVNWFEDQLNRAWQEPSRYWPRWKPTICMTQTMKEAGFDPGPANLGQRIVRRISSAVRRRVHLRSQ